MVTAVDRAKAKQGKQPGRLLRWAVQVDGRLQSMGTRSRASLVFGAVAIVVLFFSRGLLEGSGGYELYVDPALPASHTLLRGICDRSAEQWSPSNLGHRVPFPGDYIVCLGINEALRIGVPAWALSRFIPVLSLLLAGTGMALFLLQATKQGRLGIVSPRVSTNLVIIILLGSCYALSSYSFNELAASHFVYIVALASFAWSLVVIIQNWPVALRILLAGGLLGLAFCQFQFVLLAPAGLLLISILLGSWQVARTAAAASAVGVLFHLPWLIPLAMYPAGIRLSDYLVPDVQAKFVVLPYDAARLTGLVGGFDRVSVSSWSWLWNATTVALPALGLIGIRRLPLKRGLILLVGILSVLYFGWNVAAPGYAWWARFLPYSIDAVLRERYSVAFIILVLLCVAGFLGLQRLRSFPWLGILAGVAAAVACLGPFLDGHLGPFGTIRSDFADATRVTQDIQARGGGTVLTLPFGSIVQGVGWNYLGRNPFHLGGPDNTLDSQGDPESPAMPLLSQLVADLRSPSGERAHEGTELMRLLQVRWVVDWKTYSWDVQFDRRGSLDALARMGAVLKRSYASADLYELPQSPPRASLESQRLYVESEPRIGGMAQAEAWSGILAISEKADGSDMLRLAAATHSVIHLGHREVQTDLSPTQLQVTEEVWTAHGGAPHPATEVYTLSRDQSDALAFDDGTPIPEGSNRIWIDGPAYIVHTASQTEAPVSSDLATAVARVQDTNDVTGLGTGAAGISARLIPSAQGSPPAAFEVLATRDQAGVPFELPAPGADYSATFEAATAGDGSASVQFVGEGTTALASVDIAGGGDWHRYSLHVRPDGTRQSTYLYFYAGHGSTASPTRLQVRALRITRTGTLGTAMRLSLRTITDGWLGSAQGTQLVPQTNSRAIDVVHSSDSVQDTRRTSTATLEELGIRALQEGRDPLGADDLAVYARSDQAGLPIPLDTSAGRYVIRAEVRHVQGSKAHLAAIANGVTALAETALPDRSDWQSITLTFTVPSSVKSLYLYLYVDGTGGSTPSIEMLGTVLRQHEPFFPPVVLDAAGPEKPCTADTTITGSDCPLWVAQFTGRDRWWEASMKSSLHQDTLLANGFGNVWQIPGGKSAKNVSFVYAPQVLFAHLRRAVAIAWLVALALTLILIRWRRRVTRTAPRGS